MTNSPFLCFLTATLLGSLAAPLAPAQDRVTVPVEGIRGTLFLHGGGEPTAELLHSFWQAAGGANARIVSILSAERKADAAASSWHGHSVASAEQLHATSREIADQPDFVRPLEKATAVWIDGPDPARHEAIYVGTRVQSAVRDLLERGGVVAGAAGGAEIIGRTFIHGAREKPTIGRGFGLLPNSMVVTSDPPRRKAATVIELLSQFPGIVGYKIDGGATLMVRGRRIFVGGEGTAFVYLPPSATRAAREDSLKGGRQIDFIAMSRAAIARCQPPHPAAKPPAPSVSNGTLVIVGGGLTPEITERFIEAAGGKEEGRIVVIPTASGEPMASRPGHGLFLRAVGVRYVRVVHARNRRQADHPELLEALRQATGIWFGGGRQWRLVDSYLGTEAEKLMHGVLQRGGAIGGSSAGATIQADYLVRGNPLGNRQMMSEGYERGLGFIRGVAIDQHFAQRNRFADMSKLKKTFPQLIGLGIDEQTAVVVRGHSMEVIGRNQVAVYDRQDATARDVTRHRSLKAGQRYNFKRKTVLERH